MQKRMLACDFHFHSHSEEEKCFLRPIHCCNVISHMKLAQEVEILRNYTARSEHEFLQQHLSQQEGTDERYIRSTIL